MRFSFLFSSLFILLFARCETPREREREASGTLPERECKDARVSAEQVHYTGKQVAEETAAH